MEGREDKKDLKSARTLYSAKEYDTAIRVAEDLLPDENNPRVLSEIHLFIAKCHKMAGDLKSAITSCNAAINTYSKWKDPFLFRSVCFQAFHSFLQDTSGEEEENIKKDREEADIIVDLKCTPSPVVDEPEAEKIKVLFRRQKKCQIYVRSLSEALRLVNNGGKIFVEKGVYEVSSQGSDDLAPYFLYEKSVSILGAGAGQCVLVYRCDPALFTDLEFSSKLETFLIASSSKTPILIKRFTLRNENSLQVKTTFFGVAAGTVQIEDCIFVGRGIDAIYANPQICGAFSHSFPPPYIIVRFCVFDQGTGITSLNSCVNIKFSLFIGESGSSVSAQRSSKVTVENCEFSVQCSSIASVIFSSNSDLTLSGSYLYSEQIAVEDIEDLKVTCELVDSISRLVNNYYYRVCKAVISCRTDLNCSGNMFICCSVTRSAEVRPSEGLDCLHAALSIRGKGKVQISDNVIKLCDIGIQAQDQSTPIIRSNTLDNMLLCCLLVEGSGTKPSIVNNVLSGGSQESQTGLAGGVGLLCLDEAGGLVGKNIFQDFHVSPVLSFTNAHPLLKDNRYENISLVETKQAYLENSIVKLFQTQVAKESMFYLVESEERENALSDLILRGQPV